jgi:lysine N6-hydroxylase
MTAHDLVGIGIGPFNLSLAALAEDVPGLRTLFLDTRPDFRWHPGLLVEGARMQVPFLADLVSLVDPTSRWSFLNYLRAHDRLFPFYFSEHFHLPRREYDHYCRWVARALPNCRFGAEVTALRWDARHHHFELTHRDAAGAVSTTTARSVVLGVGTEPVIPEAFTAVAGAQVFHAADYLARKDGLDGARDLTVVGSGQSGAEVFLDLLRRHTAATGTALGGPAGTPTRLRWITRSRAFAPMEYSKLGLEQFTPDYTRYFHDLPEQARSRLIPEQWQLYKAASAETLAEIHDLLYERTIGGAPALAELLPDIAVTGARRTADRRITLNCRHNTTGEHLDLDTDAVLLATGFAARRPRLLDPLEDLVDWDEQGRYRVDRSYRLAMNPAVTGRVYVQNGELHTHGIGTPDLGLGAWRAASILNSATGRTVHRLPERTAYSTFAPTAPPTPAELPANAEPGDDETAPPRKEHHRAAAPFA